MEERKYITSVKAWLTPSTDADAAEGAEIVSPSGLLANDVSPRLCRGCNQPLPENRKSFCNKACQGTWLSRRSPTVKAARAKKEKGESV